MYYVSRTGGVEELQRCYIRQERRAPVATAVFHSALKPCAPRILLIRYIRKLIVIRWSRVYGRESPARYHLSPHARAVTYTYIHAYISPPPLPCFCLLDIDRNRKSNTIYFIALGYHSIVEYTSASKANLPRYGSGEEEEKKK